MDDKKKGKAVIESKCCSEEITSIELSSSRGGEVGGSSNYAEEKKKRDRLWARELYDRDYFSRNVLISEVMQVDFSQVNYNNADEEEEEEEALFWTRDLDRHSFGDISTAVMPANEHLEDFSQVEIGRTATFVGVYDWHGGGHEAATHVQRNFTEHLMGRIRDTSTMSIDILREAFLITETSWLDKVDAQFENDPHIAGRGTCCLVGVFWRRILYLANVGDSRAIIGRAVEGSDIIVAEQLTRDDNVNNPEVRAQVQALHPDEPDFVVEDALIKGLYHIKGTIQESRSIGDAYLKQARFNLDNVDEIFKLNAPVSDNNPALSAEPSTCTIPIEPQDRFVIFASNGLWDMMTNQEAADIVHQNPKEGIAERLVTEGLTRVATTIGGTSYKDVLKLRRDTGERRDFVDDISVVVIFFDDIEADIQEVFPRHSIVQGSVSSDGESNFTALDDAALSNINWRTVSIRNLPYDTRVQTLYPLLRIWGQMQHIMFGRNGFWCEVEYFYPEHANQFIHFYRNGLIISGKLACITFPLERRYRLGFSIIDNQRNREEAPFTLNASNLDARSSVTTIREFFTRNRLQLRNQPIMSVGRNGELYCRVSFVSVRESQIALDLNGMEHLGRPISLRRSLEPQMEILQSDLEPESP